jgi:PGF-pre-PGF domain-containing protein
MKNMKNMKNMLKQIYMVSMFIMIAMSIGPVSAAGDATVILAFDDGWTNTYDVVKPILDNNNQKAVIFALAEPVIGEWEDYMSIDQLRMLYDDEWDISSHSYTHGSAYPTDSLEQINYLINADNSELKYELGDSKDWLDTNGFTRSSMFFAYPYGAYDDNLIASVKASGYYIGARTIDAYSWRHAGKHPHYKIGDNNVLKMATLSIDNTTYPLQEVLNEINKTISEKGLLIITFHKIVSGVPSNAEEYNVEDFAKISAYLKNVALSGNIKVTTFSQYFNVPSPILAYVPATPLGNTITIGKDWIYIPWNDGNNDGNKTDVFDIYVNGEPTYNVVNRYINVTDLEPGYNVNVEIYAINRSWGKTTMNNTPLVVNAMIPVLLTYMPATPVDTTLQWSNNITWVPGIGNKTDHYNYIVNDTWYNGTKNTSYDATILDPGTYTIKVYAVNTTNGDTTNNTPLTKNIVISSFTYMPPIPIIESTVGKDWILTTWGPGVGNVTDLYDVNISGMWYNGTTNTSYNATNLSVGNKTIVNVYAVNMTNGRTVNNTPAILESIVVNKGGNKGGNKGSGSGSSGSSGGGGGGNLYDSNIEFYELRDSAIYNGTISNIIFTKNGLVSEVTVEGIKNYGDVTAKVSLLKKNPTNVTIDNVYRFFSVNMGTIKHENERLFFINPTVTMFLNKTNISDVDINVYRFVNGSWEIVDVEELAGTNDNRYFKLKLDGFSNFAIAFEPKQAIEQSDYRLRNQAENESITLNTSTENKEVPGFETMLSIVSILLMTYVSNRIRR